ncbi:MAG TPA: MFS transporter [Thermoanaerobaculia bacterium]|jgi:AAA family ATP:ADP antiporter|nr:MFS transporter [Thermoanaerobaculia bacterium]
MRVAVPFVTFFSVLCGYFVLRPVRDEISTRAGIDNLSWLFTGTFVATLLLVPLFGWIVARVPRRIIATATYALCVVLLLAAYAGVQGSNIVAWGIGLFIGISVLNLFIISVFWSLMADAYEESEARKMYGIIAVGGTLGTIAGPAITLSLVKIIGPINLLPISAGFLAIAAVLSTFVPRRADAPPQQRIGGNILAGIKLTLQSPQLLRIALIIICYTTISTILYFEQADIVKRTFSSSEQRTQFFAMLDLINNCTTILVQALITRQVLTRFGLRTALVAAPAVIGTGLAILALAPRLVFIAFLQVVHRAGEHGFTRPGREVIFTTVDAEERYKAKNFIDTFVYRGNDALIAWVIDGLHAIGAGLSGIAALGVAVAAGWAANGYTLGKKHDHKA